MGNYHPMNYILFFQCGKSSSSSGSDVVCDIRGLRSEQSRLKDHSFTLSPAFAGQEICSCGINEHCACLKRGRLIKQATCAKAFVREVHRNSSFSALKRISLCVAGLMYVRLDKHHKSTVLQSNVRFRAK